MEPVVDYAQSVEATEGVYSRLISLVRYIDSPVVRRLLREWCKLRGTVDDLTMDSPQNTNISTAAFHQLAERGDESVLAPFIEREIERHKDRRIHDRVMQDLAEFDRSKVQNTLRSLLTKYSDPKSLIAVVDLIARVGDETDLEPLDSLVEHDSDEVANAAFEARLRLSDPLRLANHW